MTNKEKPRYKSFDKKVFISEVTKIVDQLQTQENSRELVTQIIKDLNSIYGLDKKIVRKTATIIFKRNKEEIEELNEELGILLNMFDD